MEKEKIEVEIINSKKIVEKIEETPLSATSWLNLNLSDEKLQKIADNILNEIETIETDRGPLAEKIKEYRNQYDQIVEETSMPFPGAFNLCVPLTPKNVDACVSQTEEAFEDVDPKWTVETPPDKSLIPARDMQEKILDYYSDTEMEDLEAWTKIYQDAFLLGTGWLCMIFKREYIKVRDFVEYTTIEQFRKDYPDDYLKYPKYLEALAKGEMVKLVVEYKQEVCRSPKPEHAEWEDIYVPVNTNGLAGMLKARLVARYVPMRWEEIYENEENGDYRKGVSEKLKYNLAKDGSSTTEVDPTYLKKVYDTFEVMYFVDIDSDDFEERCLFNIEKSHKLGLRDIRYPYNHSRPYAIPYSIQNTRKGIYQPGLGEKLQPLNIALNAILNHVLNSSMIANALSLKVRSGSDAVRAIYEHQWYPGSILELMNLDDVQQFTFNTPNLSSLINLFVLVERFGQDVSGLVNYLLGQESEEDPQAPASKTIALMRKSEIKLRRYIKNLKRSNNEAGYQALRLIYQYIPKKRIAKILGMEEETVTELFQTPLKAITQSSGFAIEKMFEKRDNMGMVQGLFKEPLVARDPKRRARAWRVIAKDYGSNWDKKIDLILPTEQEITAEEEKKKKEIQDKKSSVVKQTAQKVLEEGGSEEEAREAGLKAGRNFDTMLAQQEQETKEKE